PDIRLLTTPRRSDYVEGVREVGGYTVSEFLKNNRVQAGINANFFDAHSYYLPAGTPMDLFGLEISEGKVVSAQDDLGHSAVLVFDQNNTGSLIGTNWPPRDVSSAYTAVAGNYPLLIGGKNVAPRSGRLEAEPRTAFGLSKDRRYLFLVGIDGRQPGYSDGAFDYETGGWLLLLGAEDGINLDGGGSTTLVMEGSTGTPVRLNKPSAVADSGRERTVGSHLGVFAKPLPGFISDVVAAADDTSATISWKTLQPSTTQVEYGPSEEFGSLTPQQSILVTNHFVQMTGLTPNTSYFYHVISTLGTVRHVSPDFLFTTTNYVTTNLVLELTNSWKFTAMSFAGSEWTAPGFDDSTWSDPGPGLFWLDVRTSGSPLPEELRMTQLPADPNNSGYPYVTYYFRTHFTLPQVVAGSSLALAGYVDDGAIVYLNGAEIWRLRMPEESTAETLATGFPCEGDATCLEEYLVAPAALTNLVPGDNILSAEVHNYNLRSSDVAFGLTASVIQPIVQTVQLSVLSTGSALTLQWENADFALESADSPAGPWSPESLSSPASISASMTKRFYRLRK
ncbi:MAG TPA: phosphodiester glycosidase family protein, partial [Verrucomicrobiae bacterium]|nr:phosphodiester glycosidase family protein [Verrucomicrobiae bacterium]